ncbi:hypothetical protein PanWU01x14_329160 [Parasponia andersonii]|uniref:Uncharacterized protein n=1 Tax=Parasponia andersonii TaxID=3476 RepID=A0A2P5AIH6_PARAD|nr:hypothetical protein PanWU01x14_329160 [Parasponia andersonii]
MEYHCSEKTLQGFPSGSSSYCMAKVNNFSDPSDSYSNDTRVLLPFHPSYDVNFHLPCETGCQDRGVLLQYDRFQDIKGTVGSHREPPRRTAATEAIEEPVRTGISEPVQKGLRNLERRVHMLYVPTNRTRGLNVGCITMRSLDQDRITLERFKNLGGN